MAVVDVKVFNLEVLAPCCRTIPAPREGLSVIPARKPTVPSHRFLYNTVGRDHQWYSRPGWESIRACCIGFGIGSVSDFRPFAAVSERHLFP